MTVQYSVDGMQWFDMEQLQSRVKPEPLRFRPYLRWSCVEEKNVVAVSRTGRVEGTGDFVRWVGDWQEVEA